MRKSYRALLKIKRDKEHKAIRRMEESHSHSFDNTYTYSNFIASLPKCLKGVSWKASVQKYYFNCINKMFNDYISLKNRKLPKPVSDKEITIYERGKARVITPIHVKDRIIQKVLCDFALVPVLSKKLIYDNGASLSGKGVNFTRKRLHKHLLQAIRKYSTDFYILSYDFKSFFDSIPHKTCRKILERYFEDEDIVAITMDIIKSPYRVKIDQIKDNAKRNEELRKIYNDEYCGICLGSQVSQIMALIVGNELDHYIKDKKRVKHYARYMDDGIIIMKTKEELQTLFEEMKVVCDRLGLHFNLKKTHITKSSKGFTFLKVKYHITSTGKIIRRLTRKGITRMRRKLKKFKKKVDERIMTLENVYDSMQSWLAHAKVAQSYRTVKSMMSLYNKLFSSYRMCGGNIKCFIS